MDHVPFVALWLPCCDYFRSMDRRVTRDFTLNARFSITSPWNYPLRSASCSHWTTLDVRGQAHGMDEDARVNGQHRVACGARSAGNAGAPACGHGSPGRPGRRQGSVSDQLQDSDSCRLYLPGSTTSCRAVRNGSELVTTPLVNSVLSENENLHE